MDWFKFHHDAVFDPKVQKLSPTLFKHWVNVLCLASGNTPRGRVPPPADVAFHLRIAEGRAVVMLDELMALDLLDADDEGNLYPHNWSARQYEGDRDYDPDERAEAGSRGNHVRWHIGKKRPSKRCRYCIAEGIAIATVANRDTETDTEQIQNRPEQTGADTETCEPDDIGLLCKSFGRFGLLTATTADAIEESVDDYGLDWVQRAEKKAAASAYDGKPPWTFVEAILIRWKQQGGPDEEIQRPATSRHPVRAGANPGDVIPGWDAYARGE